VGGKIGKAPSTAGRRLDRLAPSGKNPGKVANRFTKRDGEKEGLLGMLIHRNPHLWMGPKTMNVSEKRTRLRQKKKEQGGEEPARGQGGGKKNFRREASAVARQRGGAELEKAQKGGPLSKKLVLEPGVERIAKTARRKKGKLGGGGGGPLVFETGNNGWERKSYVADS